MSRRQLANFIENAAEIGFTSFDHADIYGDYTCERLFGEALTPSVRDNIQLISKCGIKLVSALRPGYGAKHYDTSAEHIIASVHNSLLNLQTDRLDMLLLHRPDPLLNVDEVAEAFHSLKKDGKVLEFGVSNFSRGEFDLVHSRFPLVTNQIEVSVLRTEAMFSGILEYMQQRGVRPMAWSPFAGGRLFGEDTEKAHAVRAILSEIAERKSTSLDVVALAWLLRHPARIYPVVGTGKLERLEGYLQAFDISLSREEWFDVLQASRGRAVK